MKPINVENTNLPRKNIPKNHKGIEPGILLILNITFESESGVILFNIIKSSEKCRQENIVQPRPHGLLGGGARCRRTLTAKLTSSASMEINPFQTMWFEIANCHWSFHVHVT